MKNVNFLEVNKRLTRWLLNLKVGGMLFHQRKFMQWVPKRNAHKRDVPVNIDQVFEGKELGTLKSTISF